MKKNYFITAITILIFNTINYAQVGVGTTSPQGALDISSTTTGLIPPRVSLTSTIVEAPVINPQGGSIIAGTTVWNTVIAGTSPNNVAPGLYFWNGTRWVAFAGSPGGLDWSLAGNSGTSTGTDFIGTTDAQGLTIKTNNSRRITVSSTGDVSIGANAVTGDNVFEVFAAVDGEDAINGYATGSGYGVYGTTTGDGIGIYGIVNNTNALAIYGRNDNVNGTGIVGAGGNAPGSYYPTSGVSGNGVDTGVAGIATTIATGVGVRGNGNGVGTNTTSGAGAGVAGSGTQVGVFGHASNTTGSKNGGIFTSEHGSAGTSDNPYAYLAGSDGTVVYGGYFDGNQDNNDSGGGASAGMDYAYVGAISGGTTYKIVGTGSVSTIVKDSNNERRVLFAPEAPEILFQDYGIGQLKNGVAEIKIDPILSKNIFVNDKHPLKVFIQLEGDCKGVYVTNKSANGFKVKELQNGNSNVSFSWQIVANRADMLDTNGNIHSKHVDVRFPIGPGPIKHENEVKTEIVKAKNIEIK